MPDSLDPAFTRRKPLLVMAVCVLVACAAFAGILANSPLVNGSSFWRWAYVPSPLSVFWPILVAAMVTPLVVVASVLHDRGRGESVIQSLIFLAVAAFLLRLATAWLFSQQVSLDFIDYVVRNPIVGSYYTVAEHFVERPGFLVDYPELMAGMPLHAMNKPPGTVLLNLVFIELLGNDPRQQTAAIVGIVCGLISLASVPLFYALVRALGGSTTAAFHAAALWALAPGAAIFFPLFDPMLTVPTLLMALTWVNAMRLDRVGWSIGMGLTFAVTLFFTFNVLPIGLFLAVLGYFAAPGAIGSRVKRIARHAMVVAGVAVGFHVLLYILTGFNLIATLRAALANQAILLEHISRPYPDTVWWDLVDYALGVAWIPVVLAIAFIGKRMRAGGSWSLCDIAVLVGLGQLIVTAITALLPGETARVWNFLIPLILLPAALELERWPRWWPVVVYACMAFLTAMLARSMIFMWAG